MIIVRKEKLVQRLGVDTFEQTVLHKALQRVPAVGPYGPWIAGGAVRRTLQREKLDSDFDFFFRSESQFNDFKKALEDMGAGLVSANDKNHTYKVPGEFAGEDGQTWLPEMTVQLIHFRYYDSPADIIDNFDFTLSQFVYDGVSVLMGDFSLWDVANKRMVPHKISYGVSTVRRILKYANQGYTICAGGIGEILNQVVEKPDVIHQETLYID